MQNFGYYVTKQSDSKRCKTQQVLSLRSELTSINYPLAPPAGHGPKQL